MVYGPDNEHAARAALLEVRARWRAQSRSVGRTGPNWTGYLTGGLDALQQMIDDDGGTTMEEVMRSTPRTDPAADPAVDRAPTDRAPTFRRKLAEARSGWPLRTLVAVAVLSPLMLLLLVSVSGGWAQASPGWTALVSLVALASAMTLGSYLPRPGTGMRFELGCTPCAAVAALSVLVSLGLLNSSPHDVTTAVLAWGVAAFGLRQRLANPSTCPA